MAKSTVRMKADGIPFYYSVFVFPKAIEKQECYACNGLGYIPPRTMMDYEETCDRCRGEKVIDPLTCTSRDYELSEYLAGCLDSYLKTDEALTTEWLDETLTRIDYPGLVWELPNKSHGTVLQWRGNANGGGYEVAVRVPNGLVTTAVICRTQEDVRRLLELI